MKNLCPVCKSNELHEDEVMNPISRKDNKTYICNDCGARESLEEMENYLGHLKHIKY